MTLPQITAPEGTPAFQLPHGVDEESLFADIEFAQGHCRSRRLFTVPTRVVPVQLFLTLAQAVAVRAWIKDDLLQAERPFSARVKAQGVGMLWWHAEWVEPPEFEALNRDKWRVTGFLLLTGEGSVDGPELTTLEMEITAALTGEAVITVVPMLAMEITAALDAGQLLAMEIEVALLQDTNNNGSLLREDSGYILREDGFRISRD